MEWLLWLLGLGGSLLSTAEQARQTDEANRRTDEQIEEAMRIARERAEQGLGLYDEGSAQSLAALQAANAELTNRADRLPGQYESSRLDFLRNLGQRNAEVQRDWAGNLQNFLGALGSENEELVGGYRDRYRRAEEELKGYGEQQKEDIDRRFAEERGMVEQNLLDRGLLSSTQAGKDLLGVTERQSAEQRRLAEDLTRNRLNFLSALSGEELGARERLGAQRSGYQWGGMQSAYNAQNAADAAAAAYDAAMRGDVNTANQLALQHGYAADTNLANWYGTNASNRSNLYMGGMGDVLNTLMSINYVPPPPNQLPYQLGGIVVDPAKAPGFDWRSLLGPGIGAGGSIAAGALTGGAGWVFPGFGGGGTLISDPNSKRDVRSVDEDEVLEAVQKVPIRKWRYRDDTFDTAEHVGPMADEFNAAFGLGDGKHIPIVDAIGVLWAAIQALTKKLEPATK